MLKTKNLMIEDWVNIMIVGYDNPVQIKEIGQFWVKVTQDDKDYGIILVQPILLTPEILEKNGFIKSYDDSFSPKYTLNYEGISFSLKYARSVFQWLGSLDIKYVHELQHLLKICGINKKIEL